MSNKVEKTVEAIRKNSRKIVRELGFCSKSDGYPVPLTQRHLLIEIDKNPASSSHDMAEVLSLDKSTTSRTLKNMASSGLLEINRDTNDKRNYRLSLSEKGHETLLKINAMANNQVELALSKLDNEQISIVEAGLSLYAKALSMARVQQGYSIRKVQRSDNASIAKLIRQTLIHHGANKPGTAFYDQELDSLYENYQDRAEYYVVVRDSDQEIFGGGGFAQLQGDRTGKVCELKKMYFSPAIRGTGLAEELVKKCFHASQNFGYRSCYLETLPDMTRAINFYLKLGFVKLNERMGDTGHNSCDVCMLYEY